MKQFELQRFHIMPELCSGKPIMVIDLKPKHCQVLGKQQGEETHKESVEGTASKQMQAEWADQGRESWPSPGKELVHSDQYLCPQHPRDYANSFEGVANLPLPEDSFLLGDMNCYTSERAGAKLVAKVRSPEVLVEITHNYYMKLYSNKYALPYDINSFLVRVEPPPTLDTSALMVPIMNEELNADLLNHILLAVLNRCLDETKLMPEGD
ncbi:hypothetical protein L0F63_004660 [Massospora cicadina]|nr:hypothetical protein L0F63_004660 [Massospora cicadina]